MPVAGLPRARPRNRGKALVYPEIQERQQRFVDPAQIHGAMAVVCRQFREYRSKFRGQTTARRAEAPGTVTRMGRDPLAGLGPPKADRARPKGRQLSQFLGPAS